MSMPITDGLLSAPDYDDTIEVRELARIASTAKRVLEDAIHQELERRLPDMDRWAVADIAEEVLRHVEDELDLLVESFAEAWIE